MTAADILRESARFKEALEVPHTDKEAAFLRAVADLLDALSITYGLVVTGDATQCQLCSHLIHPAKGLDHAHGCAVDALERAITGGATS